MWTLFWLFVVAFTILFLIALAAHAVMSYCLDRRLAKVGDFLREAK
jgi:formate-dependent nitrite reductase membrane component NrfD